MKSFIFILAGILFFLWFAAPFFTKRILNAGNGIGFLFSTLLILYGVFHPALPLVRKNISQLPGGTFCIWLFAILFFLLCLYVIVQGIHILSMAKKIPNTPCTLVVLGCKVYGTKASLMLEERLDATCQFMLQHPSICCVVSGGKGTDEEITEASCMKQYLTDAGIAPQRIYMEESSTNTGENITFSMEIIKKEGLCPHLALVSNEFHIYRATKIARHLGYSAQGLPAKTAWWLFATYFVRELLCIANEWRRGYTY